MEDFNSVLFFALTNGFNKAITIAGIVSFLLTSILGIIAWRRPKSESKMKNPLWAIPLVIFCISIIGTMLTMPYTIWRIGQDQLGAVNKQLADIRAKTLIPLGVSPAVVSNVIETVPNKANVTTTARGTPPYSSNLTLRIDNYNQKLFLYEVLKFKVSDGFKFSPVQGEMPIWFTPTVGYEDTDIMIITVANYPPLASNPISFAVYTFDLSKKYTENITPEIITTGIERILE